MSFQKRKGGNQLRSNSEEKLSADLVRPPWKSLLLQLSSASIPGNRYFQVSSCRQAQSRFGALFRCDTSLLPEVYQHKDWLSVSHRGLSTGKIEENFLEGSFPVDETSRLQNVVFEVFISWEHAVKRLFC